MRKRNISTKQLSEVINNGMVSVAKVECYYKCCDETEHIETDEFVKSLNIFNDAKIFSSIATWGVREYSIFNSNVSADFYVTCDFNDSITGTVINVYLNVHEGFSVEDVENKFRETIFDKLASKIGNKEE